MKFQGKDLPNEMDIFQKFTQGDRGAFKQLYDHYNQPISSLISKMVKLPDLAEEIIQEVWVMLWNEREKMKTVETPAGYLRRIAVYKAFRYLRDISKNRELMEKIKSHSTDFHNELEEMVDFKDSEKLIQQAVDELPPQRKKIWELSRKAHMSHEEIANELGLTKSTVNNQISSASTHIRQYLENHGNLIALAALFLFLQD
ncbi:RNA polymerase sigma-70 factor [Pedobacter aquatilis]|uniref:RNA polymerase sigma factor n=1 Tax=Pedobacter aquatilis TaxID=351343 RepID=UPI00292DE4F9|nr:RNA polymerase sigma-70 factor [Pedobacter aquatilis]